MTATMTTKKNKVALFVFIAIFCSSLVIQTRTSANVLSTLTKTLSQLDSIVSTGIQTNPYLTLNGTAFDGANSMSACLLVMDENFRLPEWISYSYHTLPLRYLIVAVDPRSKHWPTPVLDLFRKELPDLTILEWSDSDFVSWKNPQLLVNVTRKMVRDRHRVRQLRFYNVCLTHMYKNNRTWTAMYDTDEFLVFGDYNHSYRNTVMTPGSMEPKGTIVEFIQKIENKSCFELPRILYGTKEINEQEIRISLPDNFDLDHQRFDTLRYRYHNDIHQKSNGLGKTIINSAILGPYLPLNIKGPHRVLSEVCGSVFSADTKTSPFRLNHYLGSWEAYSFRDDARKGSDARSWQSWELRANATGSHRSDEICTWLKGFYANVGARKAKRLLQDTGLPPTIKVENHDEWTLVPS